MNPHQDIKNTENAIRDFLIEHLRKKYGSNYEEYFGVSQGRITAWKSRFDEEKRKFPNTTVERRLIYYSDFYDLVEIIKKNWQIEAIRNCFVKQKKIEFYLEELNKYRDTTAHNRSFLKHQEWLIAGICGELRSKIAIYRNMEDSVDSYFPRIESIRDNYGNYWEPSMQKYVYPKTALMPGDVLEFTIDAIDPEDLPLSYSCSLLNGYSTNNKFYITISNAEIGIKTPIAIGIRSSRDYRKVKGNKLDEWVTFHYDIFPKR